ncbi:hypothetical protein HBI56_201880 [Parastagonospora nodorum]|uniref:Uncharacterized protein n=2 Tax=Phaeosphaeria nodorum (strain SN15 / ATCC MYA-4574 / FGSC 10173) TaxID=321614 RepID=A0A7U2EWD4_PHANO|nr:hypothetical protein SNOG_15570 [Parastagonospora nodorum SN15]KAH3905660.1 hypothetical protein HBH56_216410 [Parastagonospora nodorum]EAT76945.1 hypothetical protein SNOG_15570 [Parastagonospora nodorum SN15]KAH3922617.1 hypothetical protein HBH54_221120 [Parastagonospora nodorum]KAH3942126.1 hypothetical protein HBH53_191030 [Parastagonospora nodorum]KAH3961241.1 hypothetical protein HBH51_185090 [Parastagonospora nodorum]
MPSEWIYISQPTSKLNQRIVHFPRDSNFARWDHVYGRPKPKNARTFNAYRKRLWAPPPTPKKEPSPWLNLVPTWLQHMPTWPVKQVKVQSLGKNHVMEPPEEDFMMSGALPVEKDTRDFEPTSEENQVRPAPAYEEVSPIWDCVEAREIELGLC